MNSNKVQNNKRKRNKEISTVGMIFLCIVILLYIFLSFFMPELIQQSFKISVNLLLKLIPIFLLIIVLMGVMNYYVNSKTIVKYLGKESGTLGWALAITGGILSHGSIYAWYPFLKELRDQGMRSGLVAVFLYNRAVKIPLLPLMVYYFGHFFMIVLLVFMILASIIEGLLIENFFIFKKIDKM